MRHQRRSPYPAATVTDQLALPSSRCRRYPRDVRRSSPRFAARRRRRSRGSPHPRCQRSSACRGVRSACRAAAAQGRAAPGLDDREGAARTRRRSATCCCRRSTTPSARRHLGAMSRSAVAAEVVLRRASAPAPRRRRSQHARTPPRTRSKNVGRAGMKMTTQSTTTRPLTVLFAEPTAICRHSLPRRRHRHR